MLEEDEGKGVSVEREEDRRAELQLVTQVLSVGGQWSTMLGHVTNKFSGRFVLFRFVSIEQLVFVHTTLHQSD